VRGHQKYPVDRRAGENVALGVVNDRSLATRQDLLRPATDHGALARTLVADDENVGGFRHRRELYVRCQPKRIRLRRSGHGNGLARRGPPVSPEYRPWSPDRAHRLFRRGMLPAPDRRKNGRDHRAAKKEAEPEMERRPGEPGPKVRGTAIEIEGLQPWPTVSEEALIPDCPPEIARRDVRILKRDDKADDEETDDHDAACGE